jgi:hypothetical protein
MTNVFNEKLTATLEAVTGQRYCSSCRLTRVSDGGKWLIIRGGLARRWKCAGCIESAKRRAELEQAT